MISHLMGDASDSLLHLNNYLDVISETHQSRNKAALRIEGDSAVTVSQENLHSTTGNDFVRRHPLRSEC